jgi:aerobic C4-dicarboxylate transport protein
MSPFVTPALLAAGGKSFYKTLYGRVLIATAIGVALGYFYPAAGVAMRPLGDGFIKLIRLIIAPLIFCTVVVGIAGVGSMKTLGKAGALALLYFEAVSTVALVIGLVVVNLLKPGAAMRVDLSSLDSQAVAQYVAAGPQQSIVEFLLGLIPASVGDAFAKADILQVLVCAILFGFALHGLGPAGKTVLELIDSLSRVLFGIVGIVMKAAPVGAFGAIAFIVGNFGVGTLAGLGKLVVCFYGACLLFVFVVLNAIARWHGFGIWRFIRYIKEELFIGFGTSSSESVLPRMMRKLEELGVQRSIVGLVIPAGYSFNLDGTAIYLSIATVFIAQATNTPFGFTEQLRLLAILLVTSKGSAGVAGAALVVLAATVTASGQIPVAGVALILGIHRFMGQAMAVTNLIGNGVATLVVGKWCGQLDESRLRSVLRGTGAALAESDVASGSRSEHVATG